MSGGEVVPVQLRSRRGTALAGLLHLPGGVREPAGLPTVVLCHGMESTKEGTKHQRLATTFASRGYPCLRFDFSYVGESEGRFEELTISGEVEDLQGVGDDLRARGVEALGVVGSSLGGAVALLFAGNEPSVRSLVTIAAVSCPRGIVERMPPEAVAAWRADGWREESTGRLNRTFLDDLERVDVLGAAARVRAATLVLHGAADRVVPVSDAHALCAALPEPKELVITPGGDHRYSDAAHLEALLDRTVEWTIRHLSAPR